MIKVPGDVNNDGKCSGSDSLLINQVLVGLRDSATVADFPNGDINNTVTVTGSDSLIINQVLVGLRFAPQDLHIISIDSTSIKLGFSASIATLLLQESLDGVTWVNKARINPSMIEFIAGGLTSNTEYKYRMALASNYSSVTSGITLDVQLNAPTNANTSSPTTSSLRVNWTDANNSPNEGGYEVERSLVAAGPFTLVGTTAANVTFLVDASLNPNTTYYYRVRAIP